MVNIVTVIKVVITGFVAVLVALGQALFLGFTGDTKCCGINKKIEKCDRLMKKFNLIRIDGVTVYFQDYHSKLFLLSYIEAVCVLGALYNVASFVITAYNVYDNGLIAMSHIGLFIFCFCEVIIIECNKIYWLQAWRLLGLSFVAKFVSSVYLMLQYIIEHQVSDTSNIVMFYYYTTSCEAFFLLTWSLWPMLSLKMGKTSKSIPFTVWSFEFSDIVSHLLVCIVYASKVESNDYTNKIFNTNDTIIGVYFVLFLVNLLFNFVPLYWVIYWEPKKDKCMATPLGDHVFILDLITDVPMFFITFFAGTYKQSSFIIFDLVWKAVLFVRALYIMFLFGDDRYYSITDPKCTDWGYTLDTAMAEHKKRNSRNNLTEDLNIRYHVGDEVDLQVDSDITGDRDDKNPNSTQNAQQEGQSGITLGEKCRCLYCFVLVVCSAAFGYMYTNNYSIKMEPTKEPTNLPTRMPSVIPTAPTNTPSRAPTSMPTNKPSRLPTSSPTKKPSRSPTMPTFAPTRLRTKKPTGMPSYSPSNNPSGQPSNNPSSEPSNQPSFHPSYHPTSYPSHAPSSAPTMKPYKRCCCDCNGKCQKEGTCQDCDDCCYQSTYTCHNCTCCCCCTWWWSIIFPVLLCLLMIILSCVD